MTIYILQRTSLHQFMISRVFYCSILSYNVILVRKFLSIPLLVFSLTISIFFGTLNITSSKKILNYHYNNLFHFFTAIILCIGQICLAIVIYGFDLYVAERLKAKNDNEIKRSYNNNNNCIKKGNIQIEYFLDRIIIIYSTFLQL